MLVFIYAAPKNKRNRSQMIHFHLQSYGVFGPGQPLRRTEWPHFGLLFVHEGRLVVRPDPGDPVELVAGEGILLFPNTPVVSGDARAVARVSVQYFDLTGDQPLPGGFGRLRESRRGFLLRRGPRDRELERDIQRAIRMAEENAAAAPESHLMREALLVLILGRFLAPDAADAPATPAGAGDLTGLIEWLGRRPPGELDSQALARHLGVSLSTLRRRFRKHLGISPAQYLLRIRMNEAKRLLGKTMVPIKEIAARCGYGSAIAFHRAFRESTGITPRVFRLDPVRKG